MHSSILILRHRVCIANEDNCHDTYIGLCSTLLPTCNLKMVGSYVSYHTKQIIETSGVHVEHHINHDKSPGTNCKLFYFIAKYLPCVLHREWIPSEVLYFVSWYSLTYVNQCTELLVAQSILTCLLIISYGVYLNFFIP